MDDYKKKTIEDILTHYGEDSQNYLGSVSPPIFQSSLFSRKSGQWGYQYTRVDNPTVSILEKKLALLEKGEKALAFSSGMAAITAGIMKLVQPHSHVVCVKNVYLSTEAFLSKYLKEKMDIETTYFEADDYDGFENSIKDNTSLIYLETCVSNTFEVPDIKRICTYAKKHQIKVMIDNTYATPIFCNPLELGVDFVVHSLSKYIGGHSDSIGGVLVGDENTLSEIQGWERSLYGATMDPHQAWLFIRSLRTLSLRMERHMENAIKVATFLEKHDKIAKVIYPALESHPQHALSRSILSGYPGLFSFVPAGGVKKAEQFYEHLQLPEKGPSWGGHETLMNTPGFGLDNMQAKLRGIYPGQIRVSIGLENADTIIADFQQALEKI